MKRTSINLGEKWIGQRFGKLTVLSFGFNESLSRNTWICQCDCGNTVEVYPANARAGRVRSCGCAQIESATTHGMRNTRIYRIWVDMRRRCRDEKHETYKNYGARGISVCEEWNSSFESFMKWAFENNYADDLTIDRVDVNGNYEPSNCRWATTKQQARNRRNTRYLEVFGENLSVSEAIEKYGNGVRMDTVLKRIDIHGYSAEDAITKPVR